MITIYLLHVSSDSLYLDFRVECPTDYHFTSILITKYNPLKSEYYIEEFEVGQFCTNNPIQPIRVALSALTPGSENPIVGATMYTVEFTAESTIEENPQLTAVGVCSNVNFVYENQLDLIMNMLDCCISAEDYDNLDRNHTILYAHQEAMRLERYADAEYFYDIIWKRFTHCGPATRQPNIINKPCNCN